MFYQKLCETKLVDLFETNNFVFLRFFFRISHIIVKKLNFWFLIVFFKLKRKICILWKNVTIQICRSLCRKYYCMITFFRVSYNLTGKWNFDIDFFRIWICCNISNFDLKTFSWKSLSFRFLLNFVNKYFLPWSTKR